MSDGKRRRRQMRCRRWDTGPNLKGVPIGLGEIENLKKMGLRVAGRGKFDPQTILCLLLNNVLQPMPIEPRAENLFGGARKKHLVFILRRAPGLKFKMI